MCGGLTHDESIGGQQGENLYITTDSDPAAALNAAIES
jgi:hypothetical protein